MFCPTVEATHVAIVDPSHLYNRHRRLIIRRHIPSIHSFHEVVVVGVKRIMRYAHADTGAMVAPASHAY